MVSAADNIAEISLFPSRPRHNVVPGDIYFFLLALRIFLFLYASFLTHFDMILRSSSPELSFFGPLVIFLIPCYIKQSLCLALRCLGISLSVSMDYIAH